MPLAIYPLSADPIHNGHLYNLSVAVNSGLFEKVYVAVLNNPLKNGKYLFNIEERINLAKNTVYSFGFDNQKIEVCTFTGLLRNYSKKNGIDYIIRGSRNGLDFEYEAMIADYNSEYGLKTFIVPSFEGLKNVSSSFVKAIAIEGGLNHKYVHPSVKQALEEKLKGISIIGVTGNMGAGKTTFCENLVDYNRLYGELKISHIDLDKLVHSLYYEESKLSHEVRTKIKECFGENLFDESTLNRKKLAGIVFGDTNKRNQLSEILRIPAIIKLEEELKQRNGIVLIDAAYLTEYNMLPIVNQNVIFIKCDEEERFKRVLKRDNMDKEEVVAKSIAQHGEEIKRNIILESQKKLRHGFYHEVDSTNYINFHEVLEKIEFNFPLFKTEIIKSFALK